LFGDDVEVWLHPRLPLCGKTFCTISIGHPHHPYVGSTNVLPDSLGEEAILVSDLYTSYTQHLK